MPKDTSLPVFLPPLHEARNSNERIVRSVLKLARIFSTSMALFCAVSLCFCTLFLFISIAISWTEFVSFDVIVTLVLLNNVLLFGAYSFKFLNLHLKGR